MSKRGSPRTSLLPLWLPYRGLLLTHHLTRTEADQMVRHGGKDEGWGGGTEKNEGIGRGKVGRIMSRMLRNAELIRLREDV